MPDPKRDASAPYRRGIPSRYIRPLSELKPGTKCVLVCRVSFCTQDHNGNLDDQEASLRRAVEAQGGIWVYTHKRPGSGFDVDMYDAITKAKELGAVLVTETVDRFIRPTYYHSVENPNAWPMDYHLRLLRHGTWQLPLYTLNDPDATPGENRSLQTKRGQREKDAKGGRPIKRRDKFREKWLPVAQELAATGMKAPTIAEAITDQANKTVTRQTIDRWLNAT